MTDLTVSVVIVSRGRPDALARCLVGVSQLQYPQFEVVVVADTSGIRAAEALPFAGDLKLVPFDEANISAARNLGVVSAAGDVIAFIDDDAVPEPQWLRYLVAPATQSDVAAMGGYVRGRNGISFQWQGRSLDRLGQAHPLELRQDRATVLHPPKGRAIKTEGTNMAVRRSVLVALGGFDPAFHYYLDETDLNVRLARAGHATALVPLAEVHHGFAANRMRHANRVPRDLFDIGASWAVFMRKHLVEGERPRQWSVLRKAERARLVRHMVDGGLDPLGVRRLMRRLDEGFRAGQEREIIPPQLPVHPAQPFRAFPGKPRRSVLLATRPARFRQDMARAAERARGGEIVTLLSLSPTALYHRVSFDLYPDGDVPGGLWVQRGGLFGKSDRSGPVVAMTTRSRRVEKERVRVARQRGLGNE